MKKTTIENIIKKYSLAGRAQQVRWKVSDATLHIEYLDPTKLFRTTAQFENFDFETTEIGIYATDSLKNILSALDAEFEMKLAHERNKVVGLTFEDSAITAKFLLASLDVIPECPPIKRIPDTHISFNLDKETMNRFAKSLTALKTGSSMTNLAVFTDGNAIELILNYHPTTNTNRISLNLEGDVNQQVTDPIAFNANLIGDIFDANKDCIESTVDISLDGLMTLNFIGEDWKTTYLTNRVDIV